MLRRPLWPVPTGGPVRPLIGAAIVVHCRLIRACSSTALSALVATALDPACAMYWSASS